MLVLHFAGRFLLTAALKRRRISAYRKYPPAVIPINYNSQFRKKFEATTYEGWNFNSGNYLFTTDTK